MILNERITTMVLCHYILSYQSTNTSFIFVLFLYLRWGVYMTVGGCDGILNIYNENNEAPFFITSLSPPSFFFHTYNNNNKKKGSILHQHKNAIILFHFLLLLFAVVHFFFCWYLILYETHSFSLTHSRTSSSSMFFLLAILYCQKSLITKRCGDVLFVCCFCL